MDLSLYGKYNYCSCTLLLVIFRNSFPKWLHIWQIFICKKAQGSDDQFGNEHLHSNHTHKDPLYLQAKNFTGRLIFQHLMGQDFQII